MSSNFLKLKIRHENWQQIKCADNYGTVLTIHKCDVLEMLYSLVLIESTFACLSSWSDAVVIWSPLAANDRAAPPSPSLSDGWAMADSRLLTLFRLLLLELLWKDEVLTISLEKFTHFIWYDLDLCLSFTQVIGNEMTKHEKHPTSEAIIYNLLVIIVVIVGNNSSEK